MIRFSYLLLLFIAILTVFNSCKKDDVDENNNPLIVGKWDIQKTIEKVSYNTNVEEVQGYLNSIEFKTNGTSKWEFYNINATYPYDYNIAGNILKITGKDLSDTYTILELSKTQLVLSEENIATSGKETIITTNEFYFKKK